VESNATVKKPGIGRLRAAGLGLLAVAVFLAIWLPLHPARPAQPTADVYTHLTVARHLSRGEGFRTDIAYPLSFAFEFARELPQPLIHRQPGFALLLTVPVAATGADPDAGLKGARLLQVALLGLVILFGAFALLRLGLGSGVLPWLVFLGFNPLLVYAVDWVFVELVCGLVMLGLWLRVRDGAQLRAIDGVLAGLLTMLRLDLFWVPILWWITAARNSRTTVAWRQVGAALLLWVLVLTPWAMRTQGLTGQPVFSLQAYAEHVKDTRDWPQYSVYRQLEPQPLPHTLISDPEPILRKVGRGVKFFFGDLTNFIPMALLMILVVGLVGASCRGRRGLIPTGRAGPLPRAGLTLILLIVQYSFFDHSLRHLLVLLPLLAWEGAAFLATALPVGRGTAATVVAILMVLISPCRLPGWEGAAREAVEAVPRTAEQAARFRERTNPVLFVPHGAIPWHIDRPTVWNPGDEDVREEILTLLAHSEERP